MRHYPRNSPQAAARLLALTMIADGHVCRSELDAVQRLGMEQALGLPHGGLGEVLQTLCEDLLQGAASSGQLDCSVDEAMLEALMADVDDPVLQRQLVAAITAAAAADGHLADGELNVLGAMRRGWGLPATAAALPAGLA